MGRGDRMLHHPVSKITLQEWHSFAAGFEEHHVFHHQGWIQSLLDTYHFPLVIYAVKHQDTGDILTALPFMRVITLKGKRKWICLPFTDFFPILGDKELVVEMVKYLHSEGILKGEIEIRIELPQDDAFHYSIGQVSHRVDLRTNEDELYEKIARNHRKALRQGDYRGTKVDILQTYEAMKEYYKLQLQVRHEKGLPTQSWEFFESVYQNLIAKECGYVALATNKYNSPMGGKVVLHWGKIATGKFAASDYAYLSYRPNHCVYWKTILWAIEQGYPVFDLGKTTMDNDGLCRFKRGWTAEESSLRYTYLGIDEDVVLQEPSNSGILSKVSLLIQKSPLFVSQILGKIFYRFFA